MDIFELVIKSKKKKVLGVFMVTYETYTKYSEVHDVEHKGMFTEC